jgi:hypothetical protein
LISSAAPPAPNEDVEQSPRFGERLRDLAGHSATPVVALVAIYLASVLVYAWVGSKHTLSDVFPDEVLYAKLSQSFADGHGLSWRGTGWELPPLWPVVLSIAWHFGSTPDGFAAAKVLGAMLASTAVVPVWLLGRELVGPRRALLAALLSIAGAWMAVTSYVLSENLAYPLGTAALASTAMAIRRPQQVRWVIWSLVFSLAAAGSRTQMLFLPVVLAVALVLDVVRQPAGERRARIDARPRALWIVLLAGVGVLLLAFVVNPRLTNYDVVAHHVALGKLAKTTGQHFLTSFVLFACIPVAAVAALMARKENWRDDVAGPLLTTIAAGVVVVFPLVGRFEAWATDGRTVDRYGMYLAPLFMLGLIVAAGRIGRRAAIAAACLVSFALLLLPMSKNYIEQPGLFGAQTRVSALGGFFGDHVLLGLMLIGLPLTVGGTLALTNRRRQALGIGIGVGLVLVLMVAQAWTSQKKEIDLIAKFRNQIAAPQLDWVDSRVHDRVAGLDIGRPQRLVGNPDLYTDFFNRRVRDMYATVDVGGACRVKLGSDGALSTSPGHCRDWPRYYVIQRAPFTATLKGQQVLTTTPRHGTLVRVPPRPPRVLSLVRPPCSDAGCTGRLELGLYVDAPGKVTATFGPSPRAHLVSLGRETQVLPPGKLNRVTFPVVAGPRGYQVPVDWTGPADGPRLLNVALTTRGKTVRIY